MKALQKLVLLMILLSSLTGCLSVFDNRVYCSADNTEMISLSKYGGLGISQDISEKDAEIFCTGAFLYNMMVKKSK